MLSSPKNYQVCFTPLKQFFLIFLILCEALPSRAETYVTLENVSVDRCAAAWFISRFVDAEAKFVFYKNGQPKPEGIGYDFFGAEYFRHGPDSTFTALIKKHGKQGNQALQEMHKVLNDVLGWKNGPGSLTNQFLNLIADHREKYKDDLIVYEKVFPILDFFYLVKDGKREFFLPAQQPLLDIIELRLLSLILQPPTNIPLEKFLKENAPVSSEKIDAWIGNSDLPNTKQSPLTDFILFLNDSSNHVPGKHATWIAKTTAEGVQLDAMKAILDWHEKESSSLTIQGVSINDKLVTVLKRVFQEK